MKTILRRLVLPSLATAFFLALSPNHHIAAAEPRKPVTLMRLYTGADGQSHTEEVEVKFEPVAGAPLSLEESQHIKAADAYLVRVPPGHYEGWHNADKRRYVLPIAGQAEIEVAGGQKVTVPPAQLALAEDLTGKGHTFRVIGSEDWVALFVDFEP